MLPPENLVLVFSECLALAHFQTVHSELSPRVFTSAA